METENYIIDLSYLTEEERERLVAVIKADEELRIRDRIRLGTVRQSIQQQRSHQSQLDGLPQCSCCEVRLGKVFNSGALCPRCGHRVCKTCRTLQSPPPPKFICSVCERQRLLDLQSNDYAVGTKLSSPHRASGTSQQPRLEFNQEQENDHPYGSELIRKSLAVLSTPGSSHPLSPVPDNKSLPSTSPFKTRPSVSSSIAGSYASSIVVRYAEREGSEDDRSLRSFSPLDEEAVTIQPAKKISLDELPEIDEDELMEEDKERGRHNAVKKHSLAASSIISSGSMGSLNSITSMYSASVGKGDYDITGEVELGVWYREGQLFVRVVRAKGLAAAKKGGVSDPYIKTYLLPDRGKRSKRKTSVQRKTTNPVFNEILKTKIEQHELSSRTLWLSVWDWDRFGRNQFLGEIRLPLSSLDLTNSKDHWHTLLDKDESSLHDEFYKGRLRVSLKYTPQAKVRSSSSKTSRTIGTLHITIHQAEDLPIMDEHGLTDATVKMYLLPNQSSSGKRKTQIVKNSLNPVWNEQFTYENICLEDLTSGRVLEVTVWDYDRRGSNDFIGGLRIGPSPGSVAAAAKPKDWMDSIGDEVSHWEDMLARPGEWVEQWHVLRPSMQPLGKRPSTSWSPKPRKKELSPVQEISPVHEFEESSSSPPAVMEGFSFSLPPTPKRSVDSSPIGQPSEGFKQAMPVEADELFLEEEEEGEGEGEGGDEESVLPASTHEFVTAAAVAGREQPPEKEATSTSRETTPIPEVVVTPVEEKSFKDQFGSTGSLHHKGDYDITGEVLVGVYYKSGQLYIHVEKARGLAAADSNGYSDPYIKTYLLPDKAKHTKQKTIIKKKTLNPVYNETLKYKYSKAELSSRTLWLSVWDWDRFGRNQFLGEVRLPLSSLDLTDTADHWHTLLDKGASGQATPQSSSAISVQHSSPGEQPPPSSSSRSAGLEKSASKHDSSHVASTIADSKPPPPPTVDSERTQEHHSKEPPQSEIHTTSSSTIADPKTPPPPTVDTERTQEHHSKEPPQSEIHTTSSSTTADSKISPVVNEKVEERQPKEPQSDNHTTRSLPPVSGGVVVAGALGSKEDDAQIERKSPSTEVKHIDTTELVAESIEPPVEPKISLAEIHQEFEDLPQKQPNSLATAVSPTKPVFSSSVRSRPNKPPVQTTAESRDTKTLQASLPARDSETGERVELKTPSPRLSHSKGEGEEEKPSVQAEEQKRTPPASQPPAPQAHSTPIIDLSEASRFTEESPESRQRQTTPPSHPGLLSLKRAGSAASFGSMTSIYSEAGGKGDYDITGEVLVGVYYKSGQLHIHVEKAKGLAAADSNGYSDPYIKTYLLPDKAKHTKQKTSVKKKTLNPVYNETLKYKYSKAELSSRTLWLSVWDWDRFGRNQFLGEVRLPLSSLDLTDSTDQWYSLQDKDEQSTTDETYKGQLKLSLMYSPEAQSKKSKGQGALHITVHQAKDFQEPVDSFVKLYLLPDKSSNGKRKTKILKSSLRPSWEEKFTYEKLKLDNLSSEHVLEVTVWNFHKRSGNTFIGGLRVGPSPGSVAATAKPKDWMDSIGDEVSHWEDMLARPGEWVEQWHTLRTTMNPRDILLH